MYCSECGAEVSNRSNYCNYCGAEIHSRSSLNIIRLKCQVCDGLMEIDEDEDIVSCPYCGSEKLYLFNERVRVEKLRKDVDIEEIHAKRDVSIEEIHAKRDVAFSEIKLKGKKIGFSFVGGIIKGCLLFTILGFGVYFFLIVLIIVAIKVGG